MFNSLRRRHQVRHRDDRGVQRHRPGAAERTACGFPPATRFELADVCKPKSDGGTLEKAGVTEVTSSVYRDGRDVPHHLALGTYVVFEGETDYARRCFKEYAMLPDKSGKYAALYRPIHMIGLELGISVASAALRHEPTGAPTGFRSDVVATAKRDLESRRDARRRGRLLRLGQADAGGRFAASANCCRSASRTTSSSSATSPKAARSSGRMSPTIRTIPR